MQFSYPLQDVTHLPPFNGQLVFVVHVLIAAASAAAGKGIRRYAMGRRLSNLDYFRLGELLLLVDDFSQHSFAIDRVRDKDGLAALSRDAFSAKATSSMVNSSASTSELWRRRSDFADA